ncbi:thioredoxin family protein [Saccharophagus degradans]|uniref:protein-disulfide reductase DsbD family protein n=1 Tax=Saccharophagus degradans TaxID=86304 RepID=UPI001C09B1F3|nr:protein-disulfide reductase DsbD domain-containing protein [Saccharophagus degradans]MBU2984786.1 thioredoxin family protein [Saccharophagus degradans]
MNIMTLKLLYRYVCAIFVSVLLLSAASTQAQGFLSSVDDGFLKVYDAYQVQPQTKQTDTTTALNLEWKAADGYYLYQHQFKAVARNATEGYKLALRIEPGIMKYDEYLEKELEVFYNRAFMQAEFPNLAPPYELMITSQGCADAGLCYPPYKHYFMVEADGTILPMEAASFSDATLTTLTLPESAEATLAPKPVEAAPFLPLVMLSAILGGLILNLMPCVFPVLSLKALSFASSHATPHKQHAHGWAYTLGAVLSFVGFAVIMLVAREAGEQLGWGFQLTNPVFVAFMVYLFFFMGLVLSGFVELGGGWMGMGQNLTSGEGIKSSFFTGVLAAVVASPCSGPFMATALGIAITQHAVIAIIIFACLGFGMALPFLLLSYNPKLTNRLPAPGVWMDTLKQFFAFPLYLTGVWLLWVLGHQVNSDAAAALAMGAVLIAFSFWLFKQTTQSKTWNVIRLATAIASLVIALGIAIAAKWFAAPTQYEWEPYSARDLAAYRKEGTPVFVDLTADWCTTCKVNEFVALNTEEVQNKAEELGIVMMQGDWTNGEEAITQYLEQFGRNSVPLYLMYPATPDAPPVVLPQFLSKSLVLEAMQKAVP